MVRAGAWMGLALAVLGLAAGSVRAGWAESLFEQKEKDFGSVARGPELAHPFRVKNTLKDTVVISNVRPSCGRCGSVELSKSVLAPGEEATVTAKMYSGQWEGAKTITIFVQFSAPQWDEVQLTVKADSHSDVQVTPERLDFGQVKRGQMPRAVGTVKLYGLPPAKVTAVESESNYVKPEWRETSRTGGDAAYEVAARLRSDTPVGRWYTELWVKTDNPAVPRLRVPVGVEVTPGLTANPAAVVLGEVKVGEKGAKKVTLRGPRAFRVTKVEGGGEGVQVRETGGEGSKEVHVLTVTWEPGKAGEVSRTVKVHTDLKDEGPVEVAVRGEAVPK